MKILLIFEYISSFENLLQYIFNNKRHNFEPTVISFSMLKHTNNFQECQSQDKGKFTTIINKH